MATRVLEIDPRRTVRDLLRDYPQLAPILAGHGLDTCCGGVHPLEQACRAKGVSLAALLPELESASAPTGDRPTSGAGLIPPTMSIREVRKLYPATLPVLERYGLGDCGGGDGPDEPVAWFATVHRLPLDEFLRDLRAAAERAPASGPVPAPAPAGAPGTAFSPHFILGSLFLTLTLGATTGMINLLRIAAGAEVPIDHRQIHAHTQILGFAGLFLMGIAYHALPRILGIGGMRPGRSVRASFWLMFAGVVARNAGQPFAFYPAGRLVAFLSGAMELVSGLLFAGFVFGLLRRAREGKYDRKDPLLRFVRAGTVYFLAAIALVAAQSAWLAGHLDPVLPPALTEPFYFAALYGFFLAWIYGFGHRVVSLFLGVGPARKSLIEVALVAQAAGVVLACASWLPGPTLPFALGLRDAGLLLAALSAVAYLAGNGFLWRRATLPAMRTPGSPTFAIRAAFGSLGLWALLEIAAVVVTRTTRIPAQNLWWADAARHVFNIGFLTLLIVGMSFRILPVFSGKTLWSPRLAHATYALLLAGTAMRLFQYPAAFEPAFYRVGSWMGVPVVLALVLFVVNLARTMRPPRTRCDAVPAVRAAGFSSTLPMR